MDSIKNIVIGTIITIVIGGTVYNISKSDVIKHFVDDTGLTQEQAQLFIDNITEEQLGSLKEIGSELINDGQELLKEANEINCMNYDYEWQSITLTCPKGKIQLIKLADDMVALGQSYIKLDLDSAQKIDKEETIRLIDELNFDYQLEVVSVALDWSSSSIDEITKTNSYNKALLRAVLESD